MGQERVQGSGLKGTGRGLSAKYCSWTAAQLDAATYPNLLRERIEKTKDARCLLHRFLDHNGYAQRHEGLRKVDDTFALRCYRQGRYGNVRFL